MGTWFGPWWKRKGTRQPSAATPPSWFDPDLQKKLELLALVSRRVFTGRLRAERRSKRRGSGIEFADHREYLPGDDFRLIDWNAAQRLDRLLLRLNEEQEDLSVYLLLDCSGSMGFNDNRKFDQARRVCAALAMVALVHLDRVTVVALAEGGVLRLAAGRGKNQIFRIVRFLSDLAPKGTTRLAACLKSFASQHPRRGVAILLSDLFDPAGFQGGVDVLRYERFEPTILHLVDARDTAAAVRGDVRVVDCETGQARDVTVTDGLLARLSQARERSRRDIAEYCRSKDVPYLLADVDTPFDELVLTWLGRGGLLRG